MNLLILNLYNENLFGFWWSEGISKSRASLYEIDLWWKLEFAGCNCEVRSCPLLLSLLSLLLLSRLLLLLLLSLLIKIVMGFGDGDDSFFLSLSSSDSMEKSLSNSKELVSWNDIQFFMIQVCRIIRILWILTSKILYDKKKLYFFLKKKGKNFFLIV